MFESITYDILAFLRVISIIVRIHEFGHFIVAKKLGVKVEKFSLGFGPKVFGRQIGETEYLISALITIKNANISYVILSNMFYFFYYSVYLKLFNFIIFFFH